MAPQANEAQTVAMKDGTTLPPTDEGAIAPDAPEWPESQHPRLRSESNVSLVDSEAVPNILAPKRSRPGNKKAEFKKRHCKISRDLGESD